MLQIAVREIFDSTHVSASPSRIHSIEIHIDDVARHSQVHQSVSLRVDRKGTGLN
jgi:hypothetical protein